MPRVVADPPEQRPRRKCGDYRDRRQDRDRKYLTPVRGTYAVKQDAPLPKKPERRKRKVRITPLHQRRINRERRLELKAMRRERRQSPAVERPPQARPAAPVIRKGHVEIVIYVKSVKK